MKAHDYINKEYFEGDFYDINGGIDINIICEFAEFYRDKKNITNEEKGNIIMEFAREWNNDPDESIISDNFIAKYLNIE